ncbi:hypothetical protein, partial [Desulfonatronovibrio magnus]|uniref:hypothetical protein n=1 Tax=Desulfonatronovibrio magnus TaxID=698827 RepID=UPI0005EB2CB2
MSSVTLKNFSTFVHKGMGIPLGVNSRPGSLILPHSDHETQKYSESIAAKLNCTHQKRLFDYLLMSSALSFPANNRHLDVLSRSINIKSLDFGLEWNQILGMKWMSMPLVLAVNGQGMLVHAFLGMGDGLKNVFPANIEELMDEQSRLAVLKAAEFVGFAKAESRNPGFFFWYPSIYGIKISGESIGLAVYAGLKMLREQLKWPNLVCTGSFDASGMLSPVSHVPEKMAAAQEAGYKGFIFPEAGTISFPEYIDIERMPVSNPEMALCLIKTFSPGKGGTHLHFLSSMGNLEPNLDLMLDCDLELLRYLEDKDCLLSAKLQALAINNHFFFNKLAKRLKESVQSTGTDLNKIHFILDKIFPEEVVKNTYTQSPRTFLSICSIHIKVRNHIGKIDDIDTWKSLADLCIKELSGRGDTHKEELLNHIYGMVGYLQNHYLFTHEKAQEIIEPYRHLVVLVEKAYQHRKNNNKDAADEYLGRYYGTMAQHYGFCGPGYIEKTLEYCDLAQEAFGHGNEPDLRSDWQRVFSYRFFAFLDAGKTEHARYALEKYLGCDTGSPDIQNLDRFQHFHLARYLADSIEENEKYVDWAITKISKDCVFWSDDHPWQLWFLNMGRVVKDTELKKAFWNKSLDICLRSFPTIKIMGLMPLSRLYELSLVANNVLEQAYKAIITDCKDSG